MAVFLAHVALELLAYGRWVIALSLFFAAVLRTVLS